MHVYGNQATFRRWLSGGDTSRDAEQLTVLESASRAVDAFCNRGSGFGPVIETRTFECVGRRLLLGADLAAITALTVNDTDIDPSDFPDIDNGYTRVLTGYHGTVAVTGPWTYPYTTVAAGALEANIDDETETIAFTSTDLYSPGMTLLIEDEQVLVTDVTPATSITVLRGQNGTAAAVHSETEPIRAYRYDRAVVDVTYRVAQRRWKQRDAGLTGVFGGGSGANATPMTSSVDSEWSILLSGVSHLRFAQLYRGGGR